MSYVIIVIGILLIIVAFNAIIKAKLRKAEEAGGGDIPYFTKTVLTEAEQVLYHRLVEALPDLIVMAQVPLSGLLGIRKNKRWQAQFNAISRKSVDFAVCRKDFSIVAVIELDDATHEREDRKKSDEVKSAAFKKVGIEVLRLKPGNLPATDSIKAAFETLQKQSPPSPLP